MQIRFFRHVGRERAWELNFIGKVWNLRIGKVQFALWRNYEPIFNFGGYGAQQYVVAPWKNGSNDTAAHK